MAGTKLLVGAVSFYTIFTMSPAYAYLDPGTGSLLIQAIIGAIAAVGITVKIYWHKLRVFFGGESPAKDESGSDDNDDSNDIGA